ncbi:MAG: hypothetical protein ACYC0C_06880 [Devosia sp.]
MKWLRAFLLAPILVTPSIAQELPAPAELELRCGLIFLLLAVDLPLDTPAEHKEVVDRYVKGGNMLVENAAVSSEQAGLDQESFSARRVALEQEIVKLAPFTIEKGPKSFEDCRPLLEQVSP